MTPIRRSGAGALRDFRGLFPDVNGRAVTLPSWLSRPKLGYVLRESAKCTPADGELFLYESRVGKTPDQIAGIRYREAKAMRICNGAPGYDSPCPVRDACFAEALDAEQVGIHGGQLIHQAMVEKQKQKRVQEEKRRAAEEAKASADESQQLAERPRPAKRRQPAIGTKKRSEKVGEGQRDVSGAPEERAGPEYLLRGEVERDALHVACGPAD